MKITYFSNSHPKFFEAEYVHESKPGKYIADFMGYHAEFLCYVLNKDYWRILGYDQNFIEDIKEIQDGYESYCQIVRDDLIKEGRYDEAKLYIYDKEEETKSIDGKYNWLIESIANLNFERYSNFANSVFLNKDSNLTTYQKMLGYEIFYNDFSFGRFTSQCEFVCNVTDYTKRKEMFESILRDEDLGFDALLNNIEKIDLSADIGFHYKIEKFEDLLNLVIYKMVETNDFIKKCPHCGKYFYPGTSTNMIYCDNISPEDSSKTCGEYCKYVKYLNKNRNDEATKLYKQIYNIKANKYKRTKSESSPNGLLSLKRELETFTASGSEWKVAVKSREKTEDEYVSWLKEIKKNTLIGNVSKISK